jgi:hypothetical protein
MKRPWKIVLVGGVVLGTGIALVKKFGSTTKPVGRVALIGDSYAVGLGPELAKIFSDFRFEGHVGTTTSQWANRVRSACDTCGDWLTAFKPDVVLVSLGMNDGAKPNPTNYQIIVRGLQSIGARVVWIEPPVTSPARAIIASLGVQTVQAPALSLAADGLHPIPAGYQIWAQKIAEAIR